MRISEYKKEARAKLEGNWGQAIKLNAFPSILTFISTITAGLIFVVIVAVVIYLIANPDVAKDVTNGNVDYQSSFTDSYGNFLSSGLVEIMISMISVGILWTSLDWYRGKKTEVYFKDSLQGFMKGNFLPNFMLNLIMMLFKFLWTLLFIFPGFIKVFSYSQTMFIYKDVNENENKNGGDWTWYITQSRQLMDGHKAQLFWLEFSFIGWQILAMLSFGIGFFWLIPYQNMTRAVFYENLAGDKYKSNILN